MKGRHGTTLREEGLRERLEQRRPVGRFQALGHGERRLPNTRSRFAVQPLQGQAEICAVVHEPLENLRVARSTQHRVAEVARRQGLQVAKALVANAIGILVEHEQFVLETGLRDESGTFRPTQDPAQQRAGTHAVIAAVRRRELADEIGSTRLRQRSFTVHEQPVAGVREPGVPPRDRTAVVELIVHIPAEYAVAEPAALGEQTSELVEADVLAAQHPVDVRQTEHGLARAARFVLRNLGIDFRVHCSHPACG